jgi:DNA-directed RNA polymerase beta subunit
MWEYDRTAETVTVYHGGFHKCTVKRRMKNATRSAIVSAIRRNPKVKPSRLINNEMVNIISTDDFKWSDLETMAEQYANVKQVQNIKDRLKN